jgi:hypothetical protein
MNDIYSEILKMNPSDLNQEEYYQIPLTKAQLNNTLDLLYESNQLDTLRDLLIFIDEEYDINYFTFYPKVNYDSTN